MLHRRISGDILMKYVVFSVGILFCAQTAAFAQTNGAAPAELPPPEFEGREYTDSQGCVFLRSTFGGEVTWIPRYGPDRRPVCGETPTAEAETTEPEVPETAAAEASAPETAAPASVAPVASAPVASAPVAASRPAPAPPARVQPRRAAPQQQRARAKRAVPRADASGRHPSCPASAPYGQLVDTTLGRPLVRCVTSRALFLDEYFNGGPRAQGEPIALPGAAPIRKAHSAPQSQSRSGRVVQVGSFGVPSNATRLRARLANAGLPARIHQSRGLNVVTVGPFASPDSAHRALVSVQRMGFGDAFLR